jgi:hypothetical protein
MQETLQSLKLILEVHRDTCRGSAAAGRIQNAAA